MSKTRFNPNQLVKVRSHLVNPSAIDPAFKTGQMKFESFHEDMHIPAPKPVFTFGTTEVWYMGVPLHMLVTCNNLRFQQITKARISIEVTNNNKKQIFRKRSTDTQDIGPQSFVAFPFSFIPDADGNLFVKILTQFTFDGLYYDTVVTSKYIIKTPFQYKFYQPKDMMNRLQLTITNKMQIPAFELMIRPLANKEQKMGTKLEYDEQVICYLTLENPSDAIEITWALPFSPINSQIIPIDRNEKAINKLLITIDDLPTVYKAAENIKVNYHVKNISEETINGKLSFYINSDDFVIFGQSWMDVVDFHPGSTIDIELSFAVLSQGNFNLPPIEIEIDENNKIHEEIQYGILIVGD